MSKRSILHLQNYKRFEDKEVVIPSDATVIIFTGDNDRGKTSILAALEECNSLKAIVPDPLKRGESEGRITYSMQDKTGEDITIIYEFYAEKKSRFYAVKNGKRITELFKIRELIGNCVQYSVPEISMKLKQEKTKKEVIEALINPLIDPELLKKINYHNAKIKTAFDSRRDKGRELETFKNSLETVKVSKEDEELIGKKEEATKLMESLKEQTKAYEEAQERIMGVDKRIEDETAILRSEIALLTPSIKSQETSITNMEEDIKKLREQVLAKEKLLESLKTSKESTEKIKKEKEDSITSIVDRNNLEKATDEAYIAKNKEEYDKLTLRIKGGQDILDRIAKAETTQSTITPIKMKVETLQKEYDLLDKEVVDNRAAIDGILKATPLPEGLSIDDDGIKIDGLLFAEEQVSESKLYLTLVDLLCKVNTSRFINAGKYSDYGQERFDELCKLAQKYEKTIYLETVVSGQEDIKVSCVINGDSSKMYTPDQVLRMEEEQDNSSLF